MSGDFDGDGDPDLLMGENRVARILWNQGHFDFLPWINLPVVAPQLIDIDHDQDLGLVVERET